MKRTAARILILTSLLLLAGCENTLPGGTDSRNKNFYDSETTLVSFVDDLQPGMTKAEVFARLGRVESDFVKLNRDEILGVLYGGKGAGLPSQLQTEGDLSTYLHSLSGYRLQYRSVARKHGLTSPIRIQTNSKGFDYTLDLVFKDGRLFEKPTLTGGKVDGVNSSTFFDFLNPGTFINKAVD